MRVTNLIFIELNLLVLGNFRKHTEILSVETTALFSLMTAPGNRLDVEVFLLYYLEDTCITPFLRKNIVSVNCFFSSLKSK